MKVQRSTWSRLWTCVPIHFPGTSAFMFSWTISGHASFQALRAIELRICSLEYGALSLCVCCLTFWNNLMDYLQWSLVQWRPLSFEETPSNGAQSLQKNLDLSLRTYGNFTSYHIFKTSTWSELDLATPLGLEVTHDDVLHRWWIERGDLKPCRTLLSCGLY